MRYSNELTNRSSGNHIQIWRNLCQHHNQKYTIRKNGLYVDVKFRQ